MPVLRVLDQPLLAGFAQRGCVILNFHVRFPVESERWRSDATGRSARSAFRTDQDDVPVNNQPTHHTTVLFSE